MKVKVHSWDGDTEYFDIAVGVLQGDTLASYLFIIWTDYTLRTSKKMVSSWKKSRRYPTQTITDADYADDSTSSKFTSPTLIPAT